jgi:hypothetical protein
MARLTLTQRAYVAERVRNLIFSEFITTTDIPHDLALEAATEAANEAARILKLTLEERGVEVEG